MSKKFAIDLYYDVMSPMAWIGFEGLLRYQKVWPIAVNLKPFLIRDVLALSGNRSPLFNRAKAKYMMTDIERNNEFWGLNLKFPKNFLAWGADTENTYSENALRIITAVQMEQPEMVETLSREYWKRLWTQGQPIFTLEDHQIVLKSAGIEKSDYFLEKIGDPEVFKKLKNNTDTALAQGAYGTPWIVVHKDGKEHCFFGSDRLHLIGQLIGEEFTHGYKELAAKM